MKFGEALQAVKIRAPVMAGGFGVWGLTFSSFDCSLMYMRGKDDPWNSIASGGLTGGLLAARMGARAAGVSALSGAVILAAIEGLTITINRWSTQQSNPVRPIVPDDPRRPAPRTTPAWGPTTTAGRFLVVNAWQAAIATLGRASPAPAPPFPAGWLAGRQAGTY